MKAENTGPDELVITMSLGEAERLASNMRQAQRTFRRMSGTATSDADRVHYREEADFMMRQADELLRALHAPKKVIPLRPPPLPREPLP